jgi:oligoribonuclease NrnB/cAMP/cGMP phosphodiesterase (DHH superfamily)
MLLGSKKHCNILNEGEVRKDLYRHHLFTHAGCLDGSASAILFMHAGGFEDNIHYVPAGRVDEYLRDNWRDEWDHAPLLFVDIAPEQDVTVDYLTSRDDVIVIDHHKSNESLSGKHGCYIDTENKACGCENFRKWLAQNVSQAFNEEHYTRFTKIIDDHDRWQLKIPFSIELPKFFAFVGQKDFVKRMFNIKDRFGTEKHSYWTPFEMDLMNIIRENQKRAYRSTLNKVQVHEREWEGRTIKVGYVITDEVNNSELLNMYLNEHPEVDIACQISFGLQKVSVRSKGTVDLSKWCKQYNGGGHPNAAGHPLPEGLIKSIIDGMHRKAD